MKIESKINDFNVTIEKGVKFWEAIISDKDWNDVASKSGFTSKEEAFEWARDNCK